MGILGGSDIDRINSGSVKETLNSTYNTPLFQPLDILLSAKIIFKGVSGTKLTLTNELFKETFSIEITDETPFEVNGYRAIYIPVKTGVWGYVIEKAGMIPPSITGDISVTNVGNSYLIVYKMEGQVIGETETDTTITIPDTVESVEVLACGGGGGGGCGNENNDDPGSGGGGGGGSAIQKVYIVNNLFSKFFDIVVGVGGIGGVYSSSFANAYGKSGTPTIITNAISLTLPGGGGGECYVESPLNNPLGGPSGGAGGGNGGRGEIYGSTGATIGNIGLIGTGGQIGGGGGGSKDCSGGGGGGSIGNGGQGSVTSSGSYTGQSGTKGSGGGGGYASTTYSSSGGRGGNGYVRIKEVVDIQ